MRDISSAIRIDASAERVWSVLVDFPAYPAWNPFIRSITGDARQGGLLRVTLAAEGGSTMRFRPKVLAARPPEELRWRGRLGIPGLFDGEHRFRLTPERGGVLFTQSERFGGILVPLLWRRLQRDTLPMFARMNQALRARAEQRALDH